jgi:hypothetical protein
LIHAALKEFFDTFNSFTAVRQSSLLVRNFGSPFRINPTSQCVHRCVSSAAFADCASLRDSKMARVILELVCPECSSPGTSAGYKLCHRRYHCTAAQNSVDNWWIFGAGGPCDWRPGKNRSSIATWARHRIECRNLTHRRQRHNRALHVMFCRRTSKRRLGISMINSSIG